MYDFLIIGAGITGSLIAHALSKYEGTVAVLEARSDVGNEATAANSAIIHSGHDPLDGTLKAKLNVRGNELYRPLCKELQVDFKEIGAFVVATSDEQLPRLEELKARALSRNVPAQLLTREEALAKEPNLSDAMIAVLELPTTGIVIPWHVAIAAMEEAMDNGVSLFLEHAVTAIDKTKEGFLVQTKQMQFAARTIINCAGVFADDIYRMVSDRVNFIITPRKGEYFVMDRAETTHVSRVIYPMPSSRGKGVLVVPTVHGNLLLGPNSDFVDDKYSVDNTQAALDYVRKEVNMSVKNIDMSKMIRTFAGLRAASDRQDFIIEEAPDVAGFINVAGIESPGLASAPAIAEYVMEQLLLPKMHLQVKTEYRHRRGWIDLHQYSDEEKNAYVQKDYRFGNMICRCEHVSEGEIVDAIHRSCGACTVKGVRKRVRPGTGRCQGGFCEVKVVQILARELKKRQEEITYDGVDSTLLLERTKQQ